MTNRRPTTGPGWWRFFLAALAAALIGLLSAGTASASTLPNLETRVRASTPTVVHVVGPHESITAGQRWGNAPPRADSASATGVAANTADRVSGPLWTATKSKSAAGNALEHFNKHRADFPHLNNSLEYVAEAQGFLRNPGSGVLTRTRGNGDVVRYDPGNNLFGVMDSTGAPKTYFRPDPASHGYPTNLDYFNAQ